MLQPSIACLEHDVTKEGLHDALALCNRLRHDLLSYGAHVCYSARPVVRSAADPPPRPTRRQPHAHTHTHTRSHPRGTKRSYGRLSGSAGLVPGNSGAPGLGTQGTRAYSCARVP